MSEKADHKGPDDTEAAKGGDDTEAPKGADEDIRAKMREALERKHEREREGEAHLQGHDKAHGVHGRSGGAREFRRKAGP